MKASQRFTKSGSRGFRGGEEASYCDALFGS
jgi:hypothetical protein